MAQIHEWLEANGFTYYQYTERIDGDDYIITVPIIGGKEQPARRGCRIVDATLIGIKNPAQEQGSAITYARRYSLLMAFGLATEDDDAKSLSVPADNKVNMYHITTLRSECERTGVPESYLLETFKVKAIEDMTMEMFSKAMSKFKKTESKK